MMVRTSHGQSPTNEPMEAFSFLMAEKKMMSTSEGMREAIMSWERKPRCAMRYMA